MTPSSLETVQDAFSSMCQQFQTLFNQGDAEGLASLYTEDAKILSPNRDFIEGKTTILKLWQGAFEMGIKSFKGEMIEAESSGNLGIFVYKYSIYGNEDQEIDKGKGLSVLKNIDGKWKIHRDVYNSSVSSEEQ